MPRKSRPQRTSGCPLAALPSPRSRRSSLTADTCAHLKWYGSGDPALGFPRLSVRIHGPARDPPTQQFQRPGRQHWRRPEHRCHPELRHDRDERPQQHPSQRSQRLLGAHSWDRWRGVHRGSARHARTQLHLPRHRAAGERGRPRRGYLQRHGRHASCSSHTPC